MEYMDIVKNRYSVRNYSDKQVEDEKIQAILECGNLAPTAKNMQSQRIFVLKSKESMEKLRSATKMAYNSPLAFVICYDKQIAWHTPDYAEDHNTGHQDASIVCTHMMFRATELGLGTCWVRGYTTENVRQALNIPDDLEIECILICGYISENSKPAHFHYERMPLENIVKYL